MNLTTKVIKVYWIKFHSTTFTNAANKAGIGLCTANVN